MDSEIKNINKLQITYNIINLVMLKSKHVTKKMLRTSKYSHCRKKAVLFKVCFTFICTFTEQLKS